MTRSAVSASSSKPLTLHIILARPHGIKNGVLRQKRWITTPTVGSIENQELVLREVRRRGLVFASMPPKACLRELVLK